MKTAVIIIHGVGEQKPMDTLRGFVDSIVGMQEGRKNYYSRPDTLSETLELRRLQAKGRDGARFFEYYWAHEAAGTKLVAVLAWICGLALRSRRDVPPSSFSLWVVVRLMFVVTVFLVVGGWAGAASDWFKTVGAFSVVWCALLLALLFAHYILVRHLGDAARYLSPRPANIRLRQSIRAKGIQLLKELHERGEYDRIIVVGHSLGSVIGYDIVTQYWAQCAETLTAFEDHEAQKNIRDCLKAKLPLQSVVGEELHLAGGKLKPDDHTSLEAFREAQVSAFREQRRLGNPWVISDFITLGSPLTHGMLLFASGADDFETRIEQRELPTCPPQPDEKGYGFAATKPFNIGEGKKFSPVILHDGAPFAVTRWTNFFFPAHAGLFGDFVGGPLAPSFGLGVQDIEVRSTGWRLILDFTLLAHTRYWTRDSDGKTLGRLRNILDLTNRRFKAEPWPDLPSSADAGTAKPTDGQQ